MMHVLVATHLFGCVDIVALFLSCTKETEPGARCLVLKPLVSHLRYASQAIQYDPKYMCPGNYRPFEDSQGNTVTIALMLPVRVLYLFLSILLCVHPKSIRLRSLLEGILVCDRQFIFSPLPVESYQVHLIFVTYNYCTFFYVRWHSPFPSIL